MSDFSIGICVILLVASAVSNLTVFYKYAMEIYEEYKNTVNTDKPTDLPPEPIQKTEEKTEESAPHAFIELTGNIAEDEDTLFKREVSLILSEESDEEILKEYNYYLRWYNNEEDLCRGFPELYDELLFRGLIRNEYEET